MKKTILKSAPRPEIHSKPNYAISERLKHYSRNSVGLTTLQRFSKSESGNVAVIFGTLLLPILAIVGGVIDYGNAINAKSKMQQSLDSAVLAAGRELQLTGSVSAAQAAAIDHFKATTSQSGSNFAVAPHLTVNTVDGAQGKLELSASASLSTLLLGVMGIDSIEISGSTSAELQEGANGNKDLEISVMMDVTGSMGGSKLAALKTAAKDLVQIVLQDTIESQYTTRVALAPFSTTINVGNYAPAVTGVSQQSSLEAPQQLRMAPSPFGGVPVLPSIAFALPVQPLPAAWSYTFGKVAPGPGIQDLIQVGNGGNQGSGQGNNGGNSNHGTGNGLETTCVTERTGSSAYTDDAPGPGTYFPHMTTASKCTSPTIIPLTEDKDALNAHIDSLTANGTTAGHLGAAWAWYMLSPYWSSIWPSESRPGDYGTESLMKVVVLMTDGELNTDYAGPDSNYQTRQLCDKMKEEGVVVYTVGFELDSSAAKQTMKYCASEEKNTFDATNSDELQAAFRQIAYKLKDLRITK